MAAIFKLFEDNGVATGTPSKGATRTEVSRTDWKNADDTTTAIQDASIKIGERSFIKYNFYQITGTFNRVFNVKWGHTAGSVGTGVSLIKKIGGTYATPTTDALVGDNISAPSATLSALSMSTTGPEGASPTAILTAPGYTQYFATQIQTTTSATPGDSSELQFTLEYSEN